MAFLDDAIRGGDTTQKEEVKTNSVERYEALFSLVKEFTDIFYRDGEKITPLKTGYIRLNIPRDSRSVASRGQRLNPTKRKVLIDYVEKLQSLDVIERIHNTEGWLNQILFVRKPDRSWRPCLDCRRTINDLAKPLVSSLPHVQDCVDALAGARFITVQDAKSAY